MIQYGGLYHRQEEWNKLRLAYDNRQDRNLVISVGAAGIGKTALIERCLRGKVREDQGYFVQGRFDELDHPDPYSPWIEAAGQLISALIDRCSADELATVGKSIERHVDAYDLEAFITLIPLLGEMMNKKSSSSPHSDQAFTGRRNFMMIFGSFLRGVASLNRPIVWFLDNVHHADAISLEIIKLFLADDRILNVLAVVAFRPVSPGHPLSIFLNELEASEVNLVPLIPTSIPEKAIEDWMAASYGNMNLTDPQQLAKICFKIAQECNGNAFAIHLCLEIMNLNREIVKETGGTPLEVGGEAHSLLGFLMQMLNNDCRVVCMAASCIGDVVDIPLLSKLVENCDLHQALRDAERYGVLKFRCQDQGCGEKADVQAGSYMFANPTYREIIYTMLDDEQRSKYHNVIAKAVLVEMGSFAVFRVVVHMALAVDVLPPGDVESMVAYCVQAGRLAMQWSEFALAAKYLQLGFTMLLHCSPGFAKGDASLMTDLYCDTAEVSILLGQATDMEVFLEEAINQTKNPVYHLKVAKVQMQALIVDSKYTEAISVGTKAMLKTGEGIKKNASFATEFKPVRLHLVSGVAVARLSTMVEPKAVATMEVMNMLSFCALVYQPELVPILACRMVKLTYESGLAPSSPFAISLLGAILILHGADFELGARCTDNGLSLVDALVDKSSRGRVMTIHWGVSSRFFKPWSAGHDALKTAYRYCMRAGDSEFGMICPVISTVNMFSAGVEELQAISNAMASVYNLFKRKEQEVLQRILRPYYQMILHLRGASPEMDPSVLTGTIMSEEEDMRYIKDHPNATIECSLLWCRALMCFHMHSFGKARLFLDKCQAILRQFPQVILASMQICLEYVSATTSARLLWKYKLQQNKPSVAQTKRRAFLESSLRGSLGVLQSLARHCADNAQAQVLMVQGELQALTDKVDAAQDSFQQAIEHCDASHALGNKAMFCEHAGLTMRVCSKEDDALDYLEDSCASYRAWGAFIKVHHIKSNVLPEAVYEWDE